MTIYNSDGTVLLEVAVDDNSYRNRRIMGDNNITLYFSLAEHIEIPVGAYCVFEGERYTLERPENLKMKHSRYFEYTVTLDSPEAKAKIWKFRNTVDGRLKFSLTAKPKEHLQMFVDNMNRRDTGWTVGECIDGTEKLISYDHVYCYEALSLMASELETEFLIKGKQVSLCKVQYNRDNPLPLSYGRGNGFKSGVSRQNGGDTPPVEILYVQGGSDNIDVSKYGSAELLLPKGQTIGYDGEHFTGEEGFDANGARHYVVDEDGLSIRRSDRELSSLTEDSLDCSDIYPKRVGVVSSVVVVDEGKNFYDFVDSTIPPELNYEECLIDGETMTVIFQSGMLAGREFDVKYYHEAKNGKAARRFEIVPQEIDGQTMPNKAFAPVEGNKYAIFHCTLPDAYIRNDSDRSGASWDMFREAVRYLYEHEELQFTFTGELDGLWAKKDWANIGGRIILGGYILFSDERFQKEGVPVRIVGIKDYINDPHSPVIELSNTPVSAGFASTVKEIESQEIVSNDNYRSSVQFTKRRFRDAQETISMLEDALLNNFTSSVSPVAVRTMSLLVGDESLQFRFVNNRTAPEAVNHSIAYNSSTKQLTAESGIIQHLTLGIKSLSSSHAVSEYRFWNVEQFASAQLLDGTKGYYLYIKADKNSDSAVFRLSETAIEMQGEAGYYHFLVGILNSEYDGERSFVSMYGFSEVLPGRVTTDKVVSGDGKSYFDMLADAMKLGDALDFNSNGDGRLRLKGTIVQNQGGDESPVGVYRGQYNQSYTYYNGDEVSYTINGVTSTYRYINSNPSKGNLPTDSVYWQVQAAGVKGDKGSDGANGSDGKDAYSPYIGTNGNWFFYDDASQEYKDSGRSATGDDGHSPYVGENGNWFEYNADTKQYEDTGVAAKGEKGDKGDQGEQGIQGLQGLQGEQGEQGIPGEPGKDGSDGKDGRTSYFHVKYAPVEAPAAEQMSETPDLYIGTYVDYTEEDSGDPSKYEWTRFRGYDGEQGIPGINGENGRTSYLHIKYSNDGGQTFASRTGLRLVSGKSLRLLSGGGFLLADDSIGEDAGEWIGTYVDYEPTDSSDVFRYKWAKVKGEQGDKGDKGDVGDYFEYRYAKNGSTTVPPTIAASALAPDGWSTEQPSVGSFEYLWMTVAKISGDGQSLLQNWSAPVRMTPKDGADGSSPALTFQGVYNSSKNYYGSAYRVDAVKYNGAYYVARTDAGTIPAGTIPTNVNFWNPFGTSFESVATGLLLAEETYVENLMVRDLKTYERNNLYLQISSETNDFKAVDSDGVCRLRINGANQRLSAYDTQGQEVLQVSGNAVETQPSQFGQVHNYNITNWETRYDGDGMSDTMIQSYYNMPMNDIGLGLSCYLYKYYTGGNKGVRMGYTHGTCEVGSAGRLQMTLNFGAVDSDPAGQHSGPGANNNDILYYQNLQYAVKLNGKTIASGIRQSFRDMAGIDSWYGNWDLNIGSAFNANIDLYTKESGTLSVELWYEYRTRFSFFTENFGGVIPSGVTCESGYSDYYVDTYMEGVSLAVTITDNIAVTKIGTNGLLSAWNSNKYMFYNQLYGFEVRAGNYVLRISSSGIQKSTDGGVTWTNI